MPEFAFRHRLVVSGLALRRDGVAAQCGATISVSVGPRRHPMGNGEPLGLRRQIPDRPGWLVDASAA